MLSRKNRLHSGAWTCLLLACGCQPNHFVHEIANDREPRAMVASGSMEPTLGGPRRNATCRTCQRQLQFSESGWNRGAVVFCPTCGSVADVGSLIHPGRAYRLKVMSSLEEINVDSLVAYDQEGNLEVKRVVGLPQQQVSIRGGEIWIDGVMHQKDWESFLRQAILVHAEGWQAESDRSGRWKSENGLWRVYHHLNLWPIRSGAFRLHPTSIHDDFFMNPSESKILTPVADIGCIVGLRQPCDNVHVQLAMFAGDEVLAFDICADGNRGWLKWSGSSEPIEFRYGESSVPPFVAVAAFDNQVWFATEQQSMLLASERSELIQAPAFNLPVKLTCETPLAIQVIKGPVSETIIVRDNYWRPANYQLHQEFAPGDGFVLLGDNVSVSQDSRHHGRIQASSLRYRIRFDDPSLENLRSQIRCFGERRSTPTLK